MKSKPELKLRVSEGPSVQRLDTDSQWLGRLDLSCGRCGGRSPREKTLASPPGRFPPQLFAQQ